MANAAAISTNSYQPQQTVIASEGAYFEIRWGFLRIGLARAESEQEALDAFAALPGEYARNGVEAVRLPGNVAAMQIESEMHADWLSTADRESAKADCDALTHGAN